MGLNGALLMSMTRPREPCDPAIEDRESMDRPWNKLKDVYEDPQDALSQYHIADCIRGKAAARWSTLGGLFEVFRVGE